MRSLTFTLFALTLLLATASPVKAGDPPGGKYASVAHSENPYDFIGKFHNDGLEYVRSSGGFPCTDPVERYAQYLQFVQQHYPEVSMSYEAMGKLFDETTPLTAMTPEKAVQTLVDQGRISERMAPALLQIYQALFDHGSSQNDPAMLAADIRLIEKSLLLGDGSEFDDPGKENELALILASGALVRYSYAYWYNVDRETANGWNVILDGGCGNDDIVYERGGGFWKKLKKAWTDTVAFFSGECDQDLINELICRVVNAGAASASCCK